MKRLDSADSFAALMSICPTGTTADEHSPSNNSHVYATDLQSMLDGLDEEGCLEESVHVAEKKRRLSIDQVKALEKNFEVENKLEPERKVKLAQELGLQPRQVAVWFQNRRARWKTKQLERDYGVLRANYESLKHNYDALHNDNEALLKEIGELKTKLNQENTESNTVSVKEEINSPEGDDKAVVGSLQIHASETKDDVNYRRCLDNKNSNSIPKSKDGSSVDSDSSAVLNDDNSLNPAISSSGVPNQDDLVSSPPPTSSLKFNSTISSSSSPSSASVSCIQFVKMEENSFFISSEEEACNFFSDEEAPTLQWYQWD